MGRKTNERKDEKPLLKEKEIKIREKKGKTVLGRSENEECRVRGESNRLLVRVKKIKTKNKKRKKKKINKIQNK